MTGDVAEKLVVRLDETIEAMSTMLNTLLDINQFESGMVRVEKVSVAVNDIFERLRNEFLYHAQARGLTFRVAATSLVIFSDPVLLEQLIRNLLSNAIKYTQAGGVVLGCRRRGGKVEIEVWDSGIGISPENQASIFTEYYQVDNAARQRSRGLGLGLSIVQRLADILDHRITVRSQIGKGTVFTLEIPRPDIGIKHQPQVPRTHLPPTKPRQNTTQILVVEDDPEVRDLLRMLLETEGHQVVTAGDGQSALAQIEYHAFRPGLILADYNLPNTLTGLEVARSDMERLGVAIPVIILTGDVLPRTLRDIEADACTRLSKPVKPAELTRTIQMLLTTPAPASQAAGANTEIYLIDDDADIRTDLARLLGDEGYSVVAFPDGESFLSGFAPERQACILIDAGLPGMSGVEILKTMREAGHGLPAIMITGHSDVAMAVAAMKAGANDFLEKPVRPRDLLTSIRRALDASRDPSSRHVWQASAARTLGDLTARQRQIMHMVLAGHPSKNIASDLGISQRTVENHRATIMAKTGARSLPGLARLALAAGAGAEDGA